MDFDETLHKAETEIGQRATGPDSAVHLEGFRMLHAATEADSQLRGSGLDRARRVISTKVCGYLKFQRDREAFPEIDRIPVRRPLFILDSGRTGSTLLQALLALDPAARTPRRWELMDPSPPPRRETRDTDPRIAWADSLLKSLATVSPDLLKAHPITARSPDECHWMMSHGAQHFVYYRYPGYWDWFSSLNDEQLLALYRQYRRQVQHLQLNDRAGHWLSKSPVHRMYSSVIWDVFPDARIVRLHRNPAQCIPSLASVMAKVRALSYAEVERAEIGRDVLDHFAEGTRRMILADRRDGGSRSVDIAFDDLIRDPIASVRHLYEALGYQYSNAFNEALQRYVAAMDETPAHAHQYCLDEFGLSDDCVREICREYLDWLDERGIALAN